MDTASWSSCTLDAEAGGAAFVAERLLVYASGDPPGIGLRTYTVEGREAFRLFGGEQVWDVQAVGDFAYVHTPSAAYVVDVRSGEVVREIVPPAELVDVTVGTS